MNKKKKKRLFPCGSPRRPQRNSQLSKPIDYRLHRGSRISSVLFYFSRFSKLLQLPFCPFYLLTSISRNYGDYNCNTLLILRNCINFAHGKNKHYSVIASNAERSVLTGTMSTETFNSFDNDL